MKSAFANPKLHALETLLPILDALREERRIVFTNGCFDILHAGHVDLLSRAKDQGDILVLGLNSDASVRRIKGPPRPIIPQEERAFVLSGLSCVDFIVLFEEDTPLRCIEAVQPNVLIKGGDWSVDKIVGRQAVEANGGLVLSLPLLPGFSTTNLIKRILADYPQNF